MNMNLTPGIPVSTPPEGALVYAVDIVQAMKERAHLMRGRPEPTAATTASWAGDLEQWACNLAAALELLRPAVGGK